MDTIENDLGDLLNSRFIKCNDSLEEIKKKVKLNESENN